MGINSKTSNYHKESYFRLHKAVKSVSGLFWFEDEM